jgi:Domain of unknown function (DUF3644)
MKSRSKSLVGKSISSMLSAIEIYNKPDFKYRDETFAILATNSWELLLKARILRLSNNKISSILLYEKRKKKDGKLSKKAYRVQNRSNNYNTISLFKAYDILINEYGDTIKQIVRENLQALVEIRDNSIHFINKDFELSKKIHETGTATIKNYIRLASLWFGIDFSQYDIFLMPIGFIRNMTSAKAISINGEEKRLLKYIKSVEGQFDDDESNDFNFTLNIDVKFRRVNTLLDGPNVAVTNDPNAINAIKVQMTEEDIREKYPWDYKILTTRLRKRYIDFKENQEYHDVRKGFAENPKYCQTRYLDPGNPRSSTKQFFNPNIIREFDKHYIVKKPKAE